MALKSIIRGQGSIVRVTPDHYPLLKSWYKARGIRIDNIEDVVSDMGYIVDGRVAGWLYVTNSNCTMIEGIISDPATIPSLRRASIRKLIGFLIDTSLILGFTNIFALSKHPSMEQSARDFGFKISNTLKVFTLNAGEE